MVCIQSQFVTGAVTAKLRGREPTCPATDAHFLAWSELKADPSQGKGRPPLIPEMHPTELQVTLLGPTA